MRTAVLLLAASLCGMSQGLPFPGSVADVSGGGGGGGGTPAVISTCNASGQYNAGSGLTRVTGLDCTAATALLVYVNCATNDATVTDSSSNTWTYSTAQVGWWTGQEHGRWAYTTSPTVSSNMTFTSPNPPCTSAGNSISVIGLTGTAAIDAIVQGNDAGNTNATFALPNVTTTQANDMVCASWGIAPNNGVTASSVSSGYTIESQISANSGNGQYGSGIACKLVASTGSVSGTTVNLSAWSASDRVGSVLAIKHN